jgi:hypothetical protein
LLVSIGFLTGAYHTASLLLKCNLAGKQDRVAIDMTYLTVYFVGCLVIALRYLNLCEAKNSDKYFLTKCTCLEKPPARPDCDFSKLSKINLRKLVDRLITSQLICVDSEGYLLPTFTSSLAPLSQVTGQQHDFSASTQRDGSAVESVEAVISSKAGQGSRLTTAVPKRQKQAVTATVDEEIEEEDDENGDSVVDTKLKPTTGTKSTPRDGKATAAAAVAIESVTTATSLAMQQLHKQFVDVIPKNCKLEGFQCGTGTGMELIFPTPIVLQDLVTDVVSRQMNEELKQLMLDLEEDDEGCKFNLHGGFRSQDGFLSRPDRSVQWLRSQIIPRIQNLLRVSNSSHLPFSLDGWGAVLRGGHHQSSHVHPGSMYAGT